MNHHFSGKAALAGTALEEDADETRKGISVQLGGASSPLDAVVAHLRNERLARNGGNLDR